VSQLPEAAWFDSPVIEIRVNHPKVDIICAYCEAAMGWKTDGRKGDDLAAPDMIQDYLQGLVSDLAPFVDARAVWRRLDTGTEIDSWTAIKLLSAPEVEN
jgi:hypothetical protein